MRIRKMNLVLCGLFVVIQSGQVGGLAINRYLPDLSLYSDVICPDIRVDCPETTRVGGSVTFHAKVAQGTPLVKLGYRWKVSTGQIVRGQGTPSITVQTVHSRKSLIRATLKVLGIRKDCPATAQCSVALSRKADQKQ